MVDGKEYKVDANLSAGIDSEEGFFLIDGHNGTGSVVDKGWSIALTKKEVGVTYSCKEDETEMLFGYSSGGKFFLYLGDGLDGSNCKVTVTSITAKEVTGTFSGKLAGYDQTGQNLTGKFANVTNGSFRVPVQEIK